MMMINTEVYSVCYLYILDAIHHSKQRTLPLSALLMYVFTLKMTYLGRNVLF